MTTNLKKDSWFARQLSQPSMRLEYAKELASREFQSQLEHALERANMSRSRLAEKLGRSRAHVTQALRRGHNLTIKTMVELASSCGYDLHIVLHPTGLENGPRYWEPVDDSRMYDVTTYVAVQCIRVQGKWGTGCRAPECDFVEDPRTPPGVELPEADGGPPWWLSASPAQEVPVTPTVS